MSETNKNILKLLEQEFTVPQNGKFSLNQDEILKMKLSEFEKIFDASIEEFLYEVQTRIADYTTDLYVLTFLGDQTFQELLDIISKYEKT